MRVCGVYTGMCGKIDLVGYGFCSPCGWRMLTAVPQNGCPSGLLVPSYDSRVFWNHLGSLCTAARARTLRKMTFIPFCSVFHWLTAPPGNFGVLIIFSTSHFGVSVYFSIAFLPFLLLLPTLPFFLNMLSTRHSLAWFVLLL